MARQSMQFHYDPLAPTDPALLIEQPGYATYDHPKPTHHMTTLPNHAPHPAHVPVPVKYHHGSHAAVAHHQHPQQQAAFGHAFHGYGRRAAEPYGKSNYNMGSMGGTMKGDYGVSYGESPKTTKRRGQGFKGYKGYYGYGRYYAPVYHG